MVLLSSRDYLVTALNKHVSLFKPSLLIRLHLFGFEVCYPALRGGAPIGPSHRFNRAPPPLFPKESGSGH